MMSETHIKLSLQKKDYLVSSISSLLRSLQAAIRESDLATSKESKSTKLNIDINIDNNLYIYIFRFSRESDNLSKNNYSLELEEYSQINFDKFINKLLNEIKSNSQKTLWGNSQKSIKKKNSRINIFLSDFYRLGSATIQFENKKITIEKNNIMIS